MILLLAGTSEARAIAVLLHAAGMPAVASLAGATAAPLPLSLPTRHGGFGGQAGFVSFLEERGITRVIDATHPFASRITARTVAVCAARDLPCLVVSRPGWTAGPGDRWTWIDDEEEAAQHIGAGATVFLATGRQTLHRFENLSGRRLLCRQIDPAGRPFPFAGGDYVISRPPFTVEAEERLFRDLGVDVLVVKDAGGAASRTKLDAARALGLPVILIRRPPRPDCAHVETPEAALAWAMT